MINKVIHKLRTLNPWHFIWIAAALSEVFGLLLNTIQSYLWWGYLSYDLLLIGVIDSLFVPLLISPIVIYFVFNTEKLERVNKELQLEVMKVKQFEGERIRERELLYRALFDNAPVGIGIADLNGDLIAFNDAMLTPGGYTREDIERIKNTSELYYDKSEREKALEITRKQGFLHQHPVQFKRKDGTPYAALLSLRPVTTAGRTYLQAMVEDVVERKKIEDALIKSEKRYRYLFNYAPIALCELDLSALRIHIDKLKDSETGGPVIYFENNIEALRECIALIKIVDMNSAMLELFKANTKQEFTERLADVFYNETYSSFKESILAIAEGRRGSEHTSSARTFAGDIIHIFVNWFVSLGCEETLSSVVLSVSDLTKLKSAEEKLEQTEEKLGKLLKTMNEGFGMQDENGVITYVNGKLCRMFGYSCSELIGRHLYDFLDAPNRNILKEHMTLRKMGLDTSYDLEWLTKDGGKLCTVISPMPLYDQSGRYIGSFATITDITERKKNEELILAYQQQLSLLSSKLSLVEENERRRIAADLHDNIGQILACAKMKLGELMASSPAGIRDDVTGIRGLIEQCITYTRSLTFELSVPILFELGLEAAVEWIGQEYQKLHSIQVQLRADGKSRPLNNDTRIILFKAIRELLNNVVKHAHARNVTISMERKDHSIQITVEDDGVGFNVGNTHNGPITEHGFGLFSIREALKNSGGSISITSAPGSSTSITLTAPLAEDKNIITEP